MHDERQEARRGGALEIPARGQDPRPLPSFLNVGSASLEVAPQPPRNRRRGTFLAMLHRDLVVGRRQAVIFLFRTLVQPAFLVFVLGYLMPHMNLVHEALRHVLMPGMVGLSMFFAGMQAVTFPLVDELGVSRELEDRLMAPIGTALVAVEKILAGALHAWVAGLMVLPISMLLLPWRGLFPAPEQLWLLAPLGGLVAILSASFGLFLGVLIPPQKLGITTAAVVAPLLFFGCTYYPWASLAVFPFLQKLVLLNPLVYASEALRAVLTPHWPHMAMRWSLVGMVIFTAFFSVIGIRRFQTRLQS